MAALRPRAPREAHVLVAGAGGIGCPAAWALAEAGVASLTLVDPDVVELSNLPRQVLFGEADLGRSKAEVAAERLASSTGSSVRGVAARLAGDTAAELLEGADLLIDATDGARTKDQINAAAVRQGLPLVHAAGLRSEGRLLDVPPGGRPCLACLFGRLGEETGTCADLGVWNGTVGAVGFLAAAWALERLRAPRAPSRGYAVLDLELGRAILLGASPEPGCPVCTPGAETVWEPLDAACAAPPGTQGPGWPSGVLDLVREACPLNLLRARRAVEDLPLGGSLEIRLGAEGAATVPSGLAALGHEVVVARALGEGLRLVVRRGAGAAGPRLPAADLARYARQIVLPEVGEAGQQRLLRSTATFAAEGALAETAALYARAAGVGRVVTRRGVPAPHAAWDGPLGSGEADLGPSPDRGPAARAAGALLADRVCRGIVTGSAAPIGFRVGADGVLVPERVPA